MHILFFFGFVFNAESDDNYQVIHWIFSILLDTDVRLEIFLHAMAISPLASNKEVDYKYGTVSERRMH